MGVTFKVETMMGDNVLFLQDDMVTGGLSNVELLELSVKKWQVIVDWLDDHPGEYLVDGGFDTCALCARYFPACEKCPVLSVARRLCEDTPYIDYAHGEVLSAAEDELAFLEDLLAEYQAAD